jgi:hypothetical protein
VQLELDEEIKVFFFFQITDLLDLPLICADNAHLKWQTWQNVDGAVAGTVTGILL